MVIEPALTRYQRTNKLTFYNLKPVCWCRRSTVLFSIFTILVLLRVAWSTMGILWTFSWNYFRKYTHSPRKRRTQNIYIYIYIVQRPSILTVQLFYAFISVFVRTDGLCISRFSYDNNSHERWKIVLEDAQTPSRHRDLIRRLHNRNCVSLI